MTNYTNYTLVVQEVWGWLLVIIGAVMWLTGMLLLSFYAGTGKFT